MADKHQVRLGAVQETLFIPLAARARETQKKHPILHDPKAAEMVRSIDYDAAKYGRGAGGSVTVLRTVIIDYWVREFLARHPAGTVVELGTGLNTRFERVDNGQVHWFGPRPSRHDRLAAAVLRRHRPAPDGGRVSPR